jgi:acetylornithine deacetylase
MKMLMKSGVRLRGSLMTAAVVGECELAAVEDQINTFSGARYRGGGIGTEFMLRQGFMADMAIIGEPTGLRVQCGNAGYVFAKITTYGKVQHSRAKHEGVSALKSAIAIYQALEAWEPELQQKYQHPRMLPVLNIGSMTSGRPFCPVVTPPRAHLFVHLTTIPGTDPHELKQDLEAVVARAGAGDPQFKADVSFYQVRDGYEVPADEGVARITARAHEQVMGSPPLDIEPSRYSVSSDGSFFDQFHIPSITYGPGGITRSGKLLTRDEETGKEALSLDNLARCASVYALAALDACEVA